MDWTNPNKEMNKHLENNCFVYVQGNEIDIEKFYELVRLSKCDELILYPERAMTFVDSVCYRPYVKSVVTENPFVISSYKRDNVWLLEKGEWVNPSQQTYGASVNLIACSILHNPNTIPMLIVSGVEGIEEYKEKVRNNNFARD